MVVVVMVVSECVCVHVVVWSTVYTLAPPGHQSVTPQPTQYSARLTLRLLLSMGAPEVEKFLCAAQ